MAETATGRVVVSYGTDCVVEDEAGQLWRCANRRKVGRPYCGDYVEFSISGRDEGALEAIRPRHGLVARPNYRGELKPMAANVDQLVVVVATEPEFDLELVDRYLVLAQQLGVDAALWLNKLDLAAPARQRALQSELEPYRALGYPVLAGSLREGHGVAALRAQLQGRTSILVGQSGVGKSSVVQHLLPDLELRIGALSAASGLGRHTTTETTLYHLPEGGDLIDSPGIRALRLGHLSPEQIAEGFVELRDLLGGCRFSDCRHRSEPDCAVTAAVADGRISARRLASFQDIVSGEPGDF